LHAGVWDAVVTCFFIDTAHNIVEYIEIISRILKDGGVSSLKLFESLCTFSFILHHGISSLSLAMTGLDKSRTTTISFC